MKIGEYLKNEIKNQGRTVRWIADQLNINYKTFFGKLERNSISGEELLMLIDILSLDIQHMKSIILQGGKEVMSLQNKNGENIMKKQYEGNVNKGDLSVLPKRQIRGNVNVGGDLRKPKRATRI